MPSARAETGETGAGETPPEAAAEPILGAPSSFDALAPEERLRVEAGTRLAERPDPSSPTVAVVDVGQELPVLEREGAWMRLRYGVFKGWVLPGAGGRGAGAARLDEIERLEEAALGGVDPAILERARAILGATVTEAGLGPYRLYTDLDDPALLARLARLAGSVAAVYRARFGLDPGPPGNEAVVLFRREADYRRLSEGEASLAGLEAHGHAGGGLAALSAEGPADDLAALLVHELVHLLNRRAFPGALPAWLEEGLAEDLAYGRVDADGRLEPHVLGGRSTVRRRLTWVGPQRMRRFQELEIAGARAALSRLLEAWEEDPRRLSLPALLALPWGSFVEPANREILYPESAFFVRFLLDGGDGDLAARFRSWLAAVAAGEPGAEEALGERLGRSWEELEEGYHRWLRREAALHLPAEAGGAGG